MNLNVKDLVVVIGEGQLKNLLSKYMCIPWEGGLDSYAYLIISCMLMGLLFSPRQRVVP